MTGFLIKVILVAAALALLSAAISALWSAVRPFVRVAGHLAIALCLSAAGAMVADTVVPEAFSRREQLPAIVALLVFPLALLVSLSLRRGPDAPEMHLPSAPPAPPALQPDPTETPTSWGGWLSSLFSRAEEDALGPAWERLVQAADWSPNRIAVIRRACDRSRNIARAQGLDPEAHSHLVVLEKRVPEFIESRISRADAAGDEERRRILDDLLDVLEEVAAACERRQAMHAAYDEPEYVSMRRHIEAHIHANPLRPVGSGI
ncbi:MAG: hypothetical protein ACK4SZ_03035 [Allosphingosinicella sp.]|uniref:hypothetical protein n=1 Tax=Allosphingosinicella sp. TaxID=2823234 RepID=UPI003939DBC0